MVKLKYEGPDETGYSPDLGYCNIDNLRAGLDEFKGEVGVEANADGSISVTTADSLTEIVRAKINFLAAVMDGEGEEGWNAYSGAKVVTEELTDNSSSLPEGPIC